MYAPQIKNSEMILVYPKGSDQIPQRHRGGHKLVSKRKLIETPKNYHMTISYNYHLRTLIAIDSKKNY